MLTLDVRDVHSVGEPDAYGDLSHPLDEAGDRLMDGEWLQEVIEAFLQHEIIDDEIMACIMYGVAGWPMGYVSAHEWEAPRGMHDLDAFMTEHVGYIWQPFMRRVTEEVAAMIMADRLNLLPKDTPIPATASAAQAVVEAVWPDDDNDA